MEEQQNQGAMPPTAKVRDDELYAQIAAGDEAETKKTHSKTSLVMSLMIGYMRLTLWIDEKRRQYAKVFRVLGGIWATLMSMMYVCGFVMLCILVVSYMRFPSMVQEYLAKNGITYKKMDIPGYIVSQIDLYDLEDKDKTYQIQKLSVSSTFSDFLNRRARSVSAKGVRATVGGKGKKSVNLLTSLARFSRQNNSGRGIRIDSVELSDAVFTFEGEDYKIPVSLSMTGVYGSETNLSAFVSINEPNLKIQGPLSVRDSADGMRWDLNIHSGQVAFPGRPLEKLNGLISVQMQHVQLKSITSDLSVTSDRLRRSLKIFLNRKDNLFSGKVTFRWLDVSNLAKPVERTKLDFDLNRITFMPNGVFQVEKPLKIGFSSSYNPDLTINSLSATLTGKLECRFWDSCRYELTQASPVVIENIAVQDQGYLVHNSDPVRLSIQPARNLFNVSFKSGLGQFNFRPDKLTFKGRQTETRGKVSLTAKDTWIRGKFNLWNKDIKASISLTDLEYKNPSVELKKGVFVSQDIFGENDQNRLSGNLWLKNNSYFKLPFDFSYSQKDGLSSVSLSMENKQINAFFDGDFNLTTGTVNGRLVIPNVNLGELEQPLNRISDLFPSEMKTVTGNITAFGRLSGSIYNRLQGPLYIALADIGITTDKLSIKHLSTALSVQSVSPFVTDPNQRVYIGQIDSFLPISDVEVILKAEENYARISEVLARIAGMNLYAGETLIPYKTVGTLIYLRNQDENLSDVAKDVSLKDWKLSGDIRGSVLLPLEIRDTSLNVKNASLQVSDIGVAYTGDPKNRPSFLGKNVKFNLRSGNITVDGDNKDVGNIKISAVLDTVLEPSGLRKTIRDVFVGRLENIVKIKTPVASKIPADILTGIRHIDEETKKFRTK